VREEFFQIGERKGNGVVNVLITGGSQGARAINEAMTGALKTLAPLKDRLSIVHQSGEADFERVKAAYATQPELQAEVKPFIEQMAKEFEKSDLVICRAGATTVAELAAAGRGAIFIPFPFAADDHQRKNAEAVARAGAGRVILQADLTAEKLSEEVSELVNHPDRLEEMARAGRKLARRDAAKSVVDLAIRVGKGM
jgi:UDP-N-acetylglucosamine--N-acetylmuramyl-(pentapeptide) pyrophosphoryl-undecaprenol N-acetylglucosamine transferase